MVGDSVDINYQGALCWLVLPHPDCVQFLAFRRIESGFYSQCRNKDITVW